MKYSTDLEFQQKHITPLLQHVLPLGADCKSWCSYYFDDVDVTSSNDFKTLSKAIKETFNAPIQKKAMISMVQSK